MNKRFRTVASLAVIAVLLAVTVFCCFPSARGYYNYRNYEVNPLYIYFYDGLGHSYTQVYDNWGFYPFPLEPNTFTREGYTFKCWVDGGGTVYQDEDIVYEEDNDISLTAQWIKHVTLTANSLQAIYDGEEHTVSGYTASDNVSFEGITATGSGVNAGEYPVEFTEDPVNAIDTTGNYIVKETKPGKLVINPRSITGAKVTLDSTQTTWNGKEQSVRVTGVTIGEFNLEKTNYSVTGSKGTDAGTYTVTVTGRGNFGDTATAEWTIAKADQAQPAAPAAESSTESAITLKALQGGEYSRDGKTWTGERTFSGLEANTEYTFLQRIKEDANHNASPASSAKIRTAKHTLVPTKAVAETCTEDGNTAYWTCSVCGRFFSDAAGTEEIEKGSWVIKARGHHWDEEWHVNEDNTEHFHLCLNEGCGEKAAAGSHTGGTATCVKKAVCSVCGKEYGETDPDAHTPETIAARPATCTESGLTEGKQCAACHEILQAQETDDALGHYYGAWLPYDKGSHQASCRRCLHTETVSCTMIVLPGEDGAEEVRFCPVCGYCEGADNMAVEEGVTIISGRPKDDLTAFVLEAGGTKYLILAFERGGLLIRPEGEITLALPKEPVEEIIFVQAGEGAAESKPEVTENKEENTLTLKFLPDKTDAAPVIILKLG